MESYFATINLIQQNIDKIKNAEKVISLLSPEDENDIDNRNKSNDDLVFISEMLRANKDEIKQLKAQLKTSSFKFIELEKTVARLTKALDEETVKVKMLMQRLEEKDSLITRLHVDIEDLTGNIDSLEQEKEEHLSQIEEQDATIHTAWYVFGTKKELKEQKIITSEGWFRPSRVLESDFNKNYFVRIDTRNTHAIPLYSTKAKILSTHPKASYSLEKENGTLTLLITERKEFWSVSSYLVIEVD
jgi:chromosome segregation ATPase